MSQKSDELEADELPAAVYAEEPWSPRAVHVGQEALDVLQDVRLRPHAVRPLPPRSDTREHDEVLGAVQRSLVGPCEVDAHLAERCRRAIEATTRHWGLSPLVLQTAHTGLQQTDNTGLQLPFKLNSLLFCGFPLIKKKKHGRWKRGTNYY